MNSTFFINRALAAEREWHSGNSRVWGLAWKGGWTTPFTASRDFAIVVTKQKNSPSVGPTPGWGWGLWECLGGEFQEAESHRRENHKSSIAKWTKWWWISGEVHLHHSAIGYKIVTEKLHQNSVSRIPVSQSHQNWGSQYWGLNKNQYFSVH